MKPLPPLITREPDYWQALGAMLYLAALDPDRQTEALGETVELTADRLLLSRVVLNCNAWNQPVDDVPVAYRV